MAVVHDFEAHLITRLEVESDSDLSFKTTIRRVIAEILGQNHVFDLVAQVVCSKDHHRLTLENQPCLRAKDAASAAVLPLHLLERANFMS